MNLQEVTTLTQQIVAQSMGKEYMTQNGYLTAIPAEKLVDVGKDVLNTDATTEKATKALVSLLARREVETGNFTPLYSDIVVNRDEWGGFMERAKIDYADIMDDPMLSLEDGKSYADIEHKYYMPKVQSKVYNEGKGILIPISYQRSMLTEAFNSYESMGAYMEKIRAKVRMTLQKATDRYCGVLVETAAVISAKATKTAVYLLTEALNAGVTGITAETTPEDALHNNAYVLFVAEKIDEIRNNMIVDTVAYNNGTYSIGSTDNILYLLSAYTRALRFGVKSGLFNKDEVAFGEFKTIPMWQSPKENANAKVMFDYPTASTMSFSADPTNKLGIGTAAVELKNVLGVLFDKKAVGLTVFKEYVTSQYTACADFWNEFLHYLTNQIVDSDFPIVAFINDFAPTV